MDDIKALKEALLQGPDSLETLNAILKWTLGLLERLEAAEREAARYRWLRDEAWGGNNKRGPYLVEFKAGYTPSLFTLLAEEAADAAIDAAMKKEPQQ